MSELSQELLKEYFEYRHGHLWWVKPTARRVSVGDRFGFETKEGYIYGCFDTEIEAAEAYHKTTKYIHGEYARFNFG